MDRATAVKQLIAEMLDGPAARGQIVAVREVPARPARFAERLPKLSPAVAEALRAQGIERLWSHQAEAIKAAMAGEHVTVVAGTASGKTLCFFVPIAEAIQQRPTARALLIYPTKALAQDQLRKLADFGAGAVFVADTYDGDTPQARRPEIRRRAQVVLTNPDMLHMGILPYHTAWRQFFAELKYVVIDEMHVYAGIFGSHTANVIRRLRRVARHYGAEPTFICCSATVGNPRQLAEALTGLPQRLVAEDGSPAGRKFVVFWNPPVIERHTGRRRSGNMEAAELLAWLVRRRVRTAVFTLARRQAELIARYARERLRGHGLDERVMPYRAGYLPEQRRAIERRLFTGDLLGVVATSALELGVDIGSLDAVVMAGYPGRISSFWQRAGRAGRRGQDSLAVLIGFPLGVDQYIMSHPDYLFEHGNERVVVDPRNPYILLAHLMCAAYELPIEQSESELFGPDMEELLGVLAEQRFVMKRTRWYWLDPETYPAGLISIRSVSGGGYQIIVVDENGQRQPLGTVDDRSAFRFVHPGAVYLHEGETYVVERLDLEAKEAIVRPAEVSYYTEPIMFSEISSSQAEERIEAGGGLSFEIGDVDVTTRIVGYRRREQMTDRDLGSEDLDLPPTQFSTQALWIRFGADELAALAKRGRDLLGSIHALEHATIAVLPLFALCDPRDIGGASYMAHPDVGGPALFVYDGYPGGVGIVRTAFERLGEIMRAVAETVRACPCAEGCPSCVQSPSCGDANEPLDKLGAAELAEMLAAKWDAAAKAIHPQAP